MATKVSFDSKKREVLSPASLEEMCLYACLNHKSVLLEEVKGHQKFNILVNNYTLRKPLPGRIVSNLLEVADRTMMPIKYIPFLVGVCSSQPENLTSVHVSNMHSLKDKHLGFLLRGGKVRSLDIHCCPDLGEASLGIINRFGSKLEYLKIGNSCQILPDAARWRDTSNSTILRTPNVKTFIIGQFFCQRSTAGPVHILENAFQVVTAERYWKFLIHAFAKTVETLSMSHCGAFASLLFLESTKDNLTSLTFSRNMVCFHMENTWSVLMGLKKLRSLDITGIDPTHFTDATQMEKFILSFPNLSKLNIDLYCEATYAENMVIKALQKHGSKPLDFLGTVNSADESVARINAVIAKNVAGSRSPEQQLVALEYYSTRLTNNHELRKIAEKIQELLVQGSAMDVFTFFYTVDCLLTTLKNHTENLQVSYDIISCLCSLINPGVVNKLGVVRVDQLVTHISNAINVQFSPRYRKSTHEMNLFVLLAHGSEILHRLEQFLNRDHFETLLPAVLLGGKWIMKIYLPPTLQNQRIVRSLERFTKEAAEKFPQVFNLGPVIHRSCEVVKAMSGMKSQFIKYAGFQLSELLTRMVPSSNTSSTSCRN